MLTSDVAMIAVSGDKIRYGKIRYANKTFCNIFGYPLNEVYNETINSIIPNMISVHHEKYMKEYENRGGGNFYRSLRHLFAKHKEGYVFPVYVAVKSIFNTKNGLEYLALIKPISDNSNQYILTNTKGQIDSMTYYLMDKLCLNPFILNSDIITVDKFIKNVKSHFEHIQTKQQVHDELLI